VLYNLLDLCKKKISPFDLTVKTLRLNLRLYNTMDDSPLAKNTYQLIHWPRLVTLQLIITSRFSVTIS